MKKAAKVVITFIVTFIFVFSSFYGLISLIKSSKLIGKAESTSAVVTVTPSNILPTPTTTAVASPTQTETPTPESDFGKPTKLSIPRLGIDLSVIDGVYVNNEWSLSNDKAHYATITSRPNNIGGNTLIYGHNQKQVFWNTKDLVSGDKLYLETDKGERIEYVYNNFELVVPTDVSIFQYEGKPRLTLLTCNGWRDQYRKLMYFYPTES